MTSIPQVSNTRPSSTISSKRYRPHKKLRNAQTPAPCTGLCRVIRGRLDCLAVIEITSRQATKMPLLQNTSKFTAEAMPWAMPSVIRADYRAQYASNMPRKSSRRQRLMVNPVQIPVRGHIAGPLRGTDNTVRAACGRHDLLSLGLTFFHVMAA